MIATLPAVRLICAEAGAERRVQARAAAKTEARRGRSGTVKTPGRTPQVGSRWWEAGGPGAGMGACELAPASRTNTESARVPETPQAPRDVSETRAPPRAQDGLDLLDGHPGAQRGRRPCRYCPQS